MSKVRVIAFVDTYGGALAKPTLTDLASREFVCRLVWHVLGRTDTTQNLTESFGYDASNRLTSAHISTGTSVTYSYDAVGNILTKSDVGSFTCGLSGGAGPRHVQ